MSLGPQGKALAAVQSKLTSVIAPALGSVSGALYLFYGAVAVAVVAMIVGIVTATGEAVSILGLPAVPPTVIAAVATAILALGTAVMNLRGAAAGANTEFLKVSQETGDVGATDWPRAVTG